MTIHTVVTVPTTTPPMTTPWMIVLTPTVMLELIHTTTQWTLLTTTPPMTTLTTAQCLVPTIAPGHTHTTSSLRLTTKTTPTLVMNEFEQGEASTSGVDYDDYFDCGNDNCNDINEWGYFYYDGDFCEYYDYVDEYFERPIYCEMLGY
jgi:hypothetical protein